MENCNSNAKEEFITRYLNKLSTVVDQNTLNIMKDAFWSVSYDFSFQQIECTDVSTTDGSQTKYLFNYFSIGKLSSGMAACSIEQYRLAVRQLCEFCNKELNNITTEDVMYFLVEYKRIHNVSDVSMEGKRKYLSSVFSYLTKHKKIKENPMLLIEPIRHKECVKKPLNDSEIEMLRINCKEKRDLAIINLFLDTGIRVSELCGIKLDDVDFSKLSCVVLGKGNKEREVYFSGKTAIHIREYLKERKDITIDSMGIKYNKNTPLFVSVKNPYNAIQKETVEQMVRNLGQSSGVVRVHPHLFRSTYATRLAQKGVSVNIIAKSLGHANLNTVERYALLDNVHIEQSIRCIGFN